MFEFRLIAPSLRVKISHTVKCLILFALVATLGSATYAQTQSTTDLGTGLSTMVASTSSERVAVPPAENPFSSVKVSKPAPTGAGSDHRGYVIARGYFFSVHRSGGDPAVISANALGNTTAVDNFDFGWKSAYKAEAGWSFGSGNSWGVRGSYFYTNQADEVTRNGTVGAPFFVSPRPLNVTFTGAADPGTLARFRERFQLHVIDLEGTYKWTNPNWTVMVSGGLRIGISRNTYTAEDTFFGTTENLVYRQERTGYGPTGAIDLRRRIGGNWWWTASARFANLFGDIDEAASFTSGGAPVVPTTRTDNRSTWVFEGESGIEWAQPFNGGANEVFLNFSGMFHQWNDLLNIMPQPGIGASATAALDNPLLPPTRTGNIRFVGGVVSVGFRF